LPASEASCSHEHRQEAVAFPNKSPSSRSIPPRDARIAELVKQMDGLEQRVRQERERADGAAARVQELQPQASRAGDAGLGQGSDGIAVKDLVSAAGERSAVAVQADCRLTAPTMPPQKSDLQAVRERLALIKKEQAAAEERKRRAWDQLRTCVGELARMAGPAMG